jgi:FkbM family methyltransferase
MVAYELRDRDAYDFEHMDFKPGDIVVDIGGNIGMISILLAKKYPFLKIYAFEPVKQSYDNFVKNIELNQIPEGVITVENIAVTKDSRSIKMQLNYENMGGSRVAADIAPDEESTVPSTTLPHILEKDNIGKIKLLKIDCEGSEYEILYNTPPEILSNTEFMRGEFHYLVVQKNEEDTPEKLLAYCEKYINSIILEDFQRLQ